MDIQTASEILEIDLIRIVDAGYVRKQYRRLALQYHPDKNGNSPESTEKFKQINEAYHHLRNLNNRNDLTPEDMTYSSFLSMFIQSIITRSPNESFATIIKDILFSSNITLSFIGLDKSIIIEVYEFLSRYKHILHVSQTLLDELKNIVIEKCKDDQIYILNPTIHDLFEGNIYKLLVEDKMYYVPLWHSEIYFDAGGGREIVVRCIPELPDNISIGENNNLYVEISIQLSADLLETPNIMVPIGSTMSVDLQVSELYLKKKQMIVLRRRGIYQINELCPCDISAKSDIIVCCHFI